MSTIEGTSVSRVAVYIDGFNLYHGMKQKHGHAHAWLDLHKLALGLLREGQTLMAVKYFTARVTNDPPAAARQNAYLEALSTTPIEIVYGRIQWDMDRCRATCRREFLSPKEKKSDTAFASHLVADAYRDLFDVALLVSGDADMAPPAEMVAAVPGKQVVIVFPPARRSTELSDASGATPLQLRGERLAEAQLPAIVISSDGREFHRPPTWR